MSNFRHNQFESLSSQWKGYIYKLSKRYSMESGDVPDLVNEGLVVLHETSNEINPSDRPVEFGKLFKTKLIHHFVDYTRSRKRKKNSVKKTDQLLYSNADGESLHSGVVNKCVESDAHQFEGTDFVQYFFSLLDETDRRMLAERLEPTEAMYEHMAIRGKRSKKIPLVVYANSLGITVKEYQKRLRNIRLRWIDVTGHDNLSKFVTKI